MRLLRAQAHHIAELRSWFTDTVSLQSWGGPHFRFPFNPQSFAEDAALDRLDTFALVNAADVMLGFGQFYAKLGRVHLCRIGIYPEHRGRSLGKLLVHQLIEAGQSALGFVDCSLYVMADNPAAIACYRSCGFEPADLPPEVSHDAQIRFMLRRSAAAEAIPDQRLQAHSPGAVESPFCSFCGKGVVEVFTLIRGPGVQICDQCVSLCSQEIALRREGR